MKVLLPGGAGFIGSTVASALLDAGHTPVIVDSFVTGRREFCRGRHTYEGDIADGALIDRIFADHPDILTTIHCAALTIVPESVERPLHYYRENASKTLDLVDHLLAHGCQRLVFSSSASIYAPSDDLTVSEESPIRPTSPYAQTKAMVEQMLTDIAACGPLNVLSLRYFNPIGADPALRTGLQHRTPSNALGSLISAQTSGRPFTVHGDDYPTPDGSPIRDFVHVWDLARAHVAAVDRFDTLFDPRSGSLRAINLGSGKGTTVLELADAFNRLTGAGVEVRRGTRRLGDTAGAFTHSDRAREVLGWEPCMSLDDGILSSVAWHRQYADQLLRPAAV